MTDTAGSPQKPPRQKLLGDEGIRFYIEGLWQPATWWKTIKNPKATMSQIVGDGSIYALLVLFGLNAVDELDRTAFGILLPDIRDHFGMSDTGITSLVALVALAALLLQLPIAALADSGNRVQIAVAGAVAWGVFSFVTGLVTTVWLLVVVRSCSGIGRAVNDPTHNSLLSDYYSIDRRPGVFSFHRAANTTGQFIGPLMAGFLASRFGWRVPFFVMAVPTAILVFFALRLKEPVRGVQERKAMGSSDDVVDTEEPAISFGEGWRTVWKIEVLRRTWYAIPFLAVSIIGFVSLASLLYDRVYGYDALQRGVLAALVEPAQLIGLVVGGRMGTRLVMRDPALIFLFLRRVAFFAGACVAVFALAPNIYIAVAANIAVTAVLAIILPGLFAVLAMAIPPRARAVGFAVAAYWAIPGLAVVPLIGWISDNWGIELGILMMTPIVIIGGLMISTGGAVIARDVNDVWTSSATRSQALFRRRRGESKLLMIKDLNVRYGQVQILFDISMEVEEGEIVAILGTNGAGKSTLLKSISGVVEADFGAVIFDGRDTTHAPPHEIAALGISQMPGGEGVFPSLTVAENLRAAAWMSRSDRARVEADRAQVLDAFPVLADRMDEPAGNLSGGQQQMLALGMALLSQPKLLMIDELSLGLAPVVVAKLVETVREISERGTTIIIVEQSVNTALQLADTAYFLEKGQIRFTGPTQELLDRPDLLRSVFLGDVAESENDPAEPDEAAVEVVDVTERVPDPEPPQGDLLTVVDVTVSFGGIRAVDNASLSVGHREVVGVIGPNGAGKTTLFDAISGLTAADSGRLDLGGHDLAEMSPDARGRLGLGRSFQDARLFPGLTVADTIAVGLDRWIETKDPINAVLRMPAATDSDRATRLRVDELVELFGLGDLRNKFLSELSTGSRRIVDLAAAVAHTPAVLLLDEPSSGIAQKETEALGPLILRLRDELGCAILVIEHDMSLISSVSDRMVAMESGAVLTSGRPADVLTHAGVVESYLGTTQGSWNG